MVGRIQARLALIRKGTDVEGRFGLRRFVESVGVLSLSSVANLARAVITAKLFAVALGPSTVGVLAQFFNFSTLVASLLLLGLTSGVSKMVAEGGQDQRRVNSVIITSSAISFVSGLAGAILLTPVSGLLSTALTGSSRYELPLLLLIWSFPLFNISNVFSFHLQGLAAIGRLTRASVLTTAFAVVALIPMTLAYGLTGAMVSVVATSAAQTAFYGVELWRAYAARAWRFAGAKLSLPVAAQLLRFGGIIMASAVVSWASVLAVRTLTLHTLGPHANGLYQVVFGLSSQYVTVFMVWMGAYVFPRLVSERQSARLGSLLNSGLRANLAIMVPIMVVSIAWRDPLIRIFYSPAFAAAAPLIPLQVFGDYLRIVGWSFAVCLFAVGHSRSHLAVIASQAVVWVAVAALLVPLWGLNAVPLSYAVSFVTYPVLGIALVRHWTGAIPDQRGLLLIALGFICVIASAAPFYLGTLVVPVMPVAVYLLNRHELKVA
jgi:O-antigen/teichoic acid export membrane protein